MAGQGPQKYPGASTAYFYQNRFGGSLMEVNVVVLHTTEGRNLPDYGGGASAPNLTAVPDFGAKRLKWYQHFDIDRSSRALVNLSGGVETNTANVVQVELVGTCDPATHAKWVKAGYAHIYWPEAPDWALNDVAEFLAWANKQHGVPLVGPPKWPAYPKSYGSAGGQRMTNATWNAFRGVCGHMHVPENTHGDPGAIDFPRLIALAKGTAPAPLPTEEDTVALTDDDIKKIGRQVITGANGLKSPDDTTIEWALSSYVSLTYKAARRLEAEVKAVRASVDSISVGGVDLDALAEKVADLLAARLAN
ncbi:hypothetical protein [Streptomyces sp. NPDC052015]|uniref:hypothetical protein n=1 Tax=Streptomyces sp. NPDC052015 TaxID=3154755 RepID=UPI003415F4D0